MYSFLTEIFPFESPGYKLNADDRTCGKYNRKSTKEQNPKRGLLHKFDYQQITDTDWRKLVEMRDSIMKMVWNGYIWAMKHTLCWVKMRSANSRQWSNWCCQQIPTLVSLLYFCIMYNFGRLPSLCLIMQLCDSHKALIQLSQWHMSYAPKPFTTLWTTDTIIACDSLHNTVPSYAMSDILFLLLHVVARNDKKLYTTKVWKNLFRAHETTISKYTECSSS